MIVPFLSVHICATQTVNRMFDSFKLKTLALFCGHFSREDFTKTGKIWNVIDIDRKGFETWRNMSKEV